MSYPARCAVCGSASGKVVWIENGYEGRSCSCGAVFTSPEPPPGAVDATDDGHPSSFYSSYAGLKANWLRKVKQSGHLLEIGCGEGFFLQRAKTLGYDVAGVDVNPERAVSASRSLGVEVRCGLFEELDFPQKYDVIYHCDLLSHFPEPVKALQKMSSMLRPRGVLVFEVGTLAEIHRAWYRLIGVLGYPQHRWLYSEQSLHRLFDRAGLRVLQTRHFGLAPSVLFYRSMALLARAARKWRGPKAPAATSAVGSPPTTTNAEAALCRIEQFFRYRVGAIAPRIGPGTLFVAACPRDANPEVSS